MEDKPIRMTHQNITRAYRPVSTAGDWLDNLNTAIKACDDTGLWRLVSQHHDQVQAHSVAAENIARIGYTLRDRVHFSEMFAVPVIEQPGARVLGNDIAWKHARHCISEALDGWLPCKARKTVFSELRTYDWVSAWRFSVLRSHLLSVVPGSRIKTSTFLSEDIELPSEAPRLGFILMVLTSEHGWPQLPSANSLRDNRLKTVVSYALQGSSAGPAPVILPPDRLQYSMADGLCLWLSMLHEAVPITGWIAAPIEASPDVVKVTLTLDHEKIQYSQFTLRKHQVSLLGVDAVLEMLSSIAPRIDEPDDTPASLKERRRLLT